MPNIQPGAGGNPYAAASLNQTQAQAPNLQPRAVPKNIEKTPTDQAQFQHRPTGTERGQRLTSESARLQIHQLIQTAVIQEPAQRPQLQLLNRPAMSSALAETLAAHQAPEAANAHAQMAGGSLAAASHQKVRHSNEDSAERNSTQSGKRARQEEQEGEFSSLADAEGGMNQGDSSQDERSDSQKKKQIIQQKQRLASQPKSAPPLDTFETVSKKTPPSPARSFKKPTLKKTDASRSVPPKDEWTF